MPSVLELLHIKPNATYTAIKPFGIDSPISRLQLQSKLYFALKDEAKAYDGNVLAINVSRPFSLGEDSHRDFIKQTTLLFKAKAEALKTVDQNIAWGALVGIVASSLSFLPLVGYFSVLGWGFCLYSAQQRVTAEAEYREALNLLVSTCNWAIGSKPSERVDSAEDLTQNEVIRNMMAILYPVLTETQVSHLIADDIEHVFMEELRNYESKYQLIGKTNTFFGALADERIAHSKRGAEFYRCVYGHNKGKVTDYLDAFVSLIPDLYKLACDGFTQFKSWVNTTPKAATDEVLVINPKR